MSADVLMALVRLTLVVWLITSLVACTTRRQTNSERTATQQILMSEAIDRALAQLPWPSLKGQRILVQAFTTTATKLDGQYLKGATEALLNAHGAQIVKDVARADYVVTVLGAAIGTDQTESLLGTPRIETVFATLPELALYKAEIQQGLAKISIAVQHAHGGSYTFRSDPAQATTFVRSRRILFFSRYETDTSRLDPAKKKSN